MIVISLVLLGLLAAILTRLAFYRDHKRRHRSSSGAAILDVFTDILD
jgi:hypothetical protein